MAEPLYRSQIDRWLLSAFAVSTGASVGAIVLFLYTGFSADQFVLIPLMLAIAAFPWWILMTTDYTVTNRSLEIRSGPFRWSVPLRDISRIEFTRSPLSSPALSLDRMRIQYTAGKQIMISPERREQFLAELRRRGVAAEVQR